MRFNKRRNGMHDDRLRRESPGVRGRGVDRYASFAELSAAEPAGSFTISHEERLHSRVIVIAPHGGGIEVLTSEIAREIAGQDFSYYSFAGRKRRNNRDLHITSHRFDEP